MAQKPSNVKKCGCQSKGVAPGVLSASQFQDKVYGKGMRVHNEKRGGGHVCTVCGTLK